MSESVASLSARQQAIVVLAAFAAVGDTTKLNSALNHALDAGLTINELKEVLVQMYAYAGFPRSLNALGEMMRVAEERKKRGLQDAVGREAAPVPTGAELLDVGTANQTKLSGAPVRGAVFEFAPAIDAFLKTHLFGDIFARDNLDWQSRELATVGALSAMAGVDAQLQAHMRISMNVGLSSHQLREVVNVLDKAGAVEAAARARAALNKQLEAST